MNNESVKRTLISCILRQLQKMDAETLREAYAAVSRISDRGKKGPTRFFFGRVGNPCMYPNKPENTPQRVIFK